MSSGEKNSISHGIGKPKYSTKSSTMVGASERDDDDDDDDVE